MLDTLLLIVMTSIGIAAVAMAITKAKVGEPLRALIAKANVPTLTYMSTCPFCTGFWLAAIWTVLYGADLMAGLSVWGTQTLFVGLMMRSLFLHEAEIGMMQDELNALRSEVNEAWASGYKDGLAAQLESRMKEDTGNVLPASRFVDIPDDAEAG